MSGSNIRVIDLPDLGAVTDASSFVIDKGAATGRFTGLALKTYCTVTTLPEAPSNNTPYGRMNGAWTPVLGDAPSNSIPYARMNAAWSPVVPEAPLTGSIYGRGSAGWTPVLPITGGTITGNLGVSNGFQVGGAIATNSLQIGANVNYEWGFYADTGTGNHIQAHRVGFYDAFVVATGARQWVGPTGAQMTLDSAGSLSLAGSLTGTGPTSSISVPGNITAGASLIGSQLNVSGNISAGGYLNVSGDITAGGHLNVSGDIIGTGTASISVPGNITGGTAVWNVPGAFGFAPGGLGRKFLYGAAYYWEWDNTSVGANLGMLSWISNGTSLWHIRATDGLCFNSVAAVGGVGPYLNSSDRRGKTGITPSTKGLAEVLQLQPVSFSRADPSTGAQEEIGFVAQDVQPVLPEAVWTAGIPLRDGSGGLDSGDPTLALSESTIAAISVNAIKELNSIIAGLTARIAALENPA